RKEWLERLFDADGSCPRSTAAMGRREGLVQIEMDDVEVHLSRGRAAQDRVEVGAVVIEEAARVVDDLRDVEDVFFENPKGVRIRQHEGERLRSRGRLEGCEVDAYVLRGNLDEIEPEHSRRGGVRAVCGVGDN